MNKLIKYSDNIKNRPLINSSQITLCKMCNAKKM